MATWQDQINNKDLVKPKSIQGLFNGQFPPSVLVDIYNGTGTRVGHLAPEAARAWNAMVASAKTAGVILDATDSYRTLESQQHLWDSRYDHTDHHLGGRSCGGDHRYLKPGCAIAACPGTSNHGFGLAVDNRFHGDGLHWLEGNALRFGWQWELAAENWHIHYMTGDKIPQAVLDYEHAAPQGDDEMKIIVPTGPGVPPEDLNQNFLCGNGKPFKIEGPAAANQLRALITLYGQPTTTNDLGWAAIKATG